MKRYAEFAAIAQEQIEEAMKQEEVLDACAQVMTDTVMHDGVIHVFGCGHSQMFAEELCFRTGGLVPVNAIIIPHYHIFPRVRYSQLMERCEGFAPAVLDTMTTSSADTMIIVSVSGRNAAGIDMAMAAKEKGMKDFPELFHAGDFTAFQRQAAQGCQRYRARYLRREGRQRAGG